MPRYQNHKCTNTTKRRKKKARNFVGPDVFQTAGMPRALSVAAGQTLCQGHSAAGFRDGVTTRTAKRGGGMGPGYLPCRKKKTEHMKNWWKAGIEEQNREDNKHNRSALSPTPGLKSIKMRKTTKHTRAHPDKARAFKPEIAPAQRSDTKVPIL